MGRLFTESVVHGRVRSRHVAQLFDSLESRVQTVASFVEDALAGEQTVMVLAQRSNWDAIARELRARGCPVGQAQKQGALVVVEAAHALKTIASDGYPSETLFDNVIGRELMRLSAAGEVSIYGELVELLAERGDFRAALHLEDMWNRLAERCSFTLLCGYSAGHFVGRAGESVLQSICAAHARVHSGYEDSLGQWILRSTH